MTRKLLTSALAAVLLVACTGTSGRSSSSSPSPSAESLSPGGAPRTIALPHLPPQGVVVERHHGAVFIALDGTVLGAVPGAKIVNPTESPGPILFRMHHAWYVLDAPASVLRRIGRSYAERLHAVDDPAIELPAPPDMTVNGETTGHWRFALLAPDGDHVLAQWSGECEIPTAYLFTLQAGAPVPITGAAARGSIPESFALGWARGNRAIVVLPEGTCGTEIGLPGVYAYDLSGRATWITSVPRGWIVRMWGSS